MNIFVVTSLLQYLCAREAKQKYKDNCNILVVVNQDSDIGKKQQEQIIQESEWDKVIISERKGRTINIPKTIKKIKKISKNIETNLFFSELYSWRTQCLINNIIAKRKIYIDDGTMTLVDFKKTNKNTTYKRKSFIKKIVLNFFGLEFPKEEVDTKSIEFFTIFNLDTDRMVKNNFEILRSSSNHKIYNKDSPILYLGQGSIGDKNHPSVTEYLSHIERLSSHYESIIYIPHRTEEKSIENEIRKFRNISYHTPNLPIELELKNNNISASAIIGSFTTALFTIRIIEPEIPVFYYPIKSLNANKHESTTIKHLNKAGIENLKEILN